MSDEPLGEPMYELIGSWQDTMRFIADNGETDFDVLLRNKISEAMRRSGPRVVLWYAERLKDVRAIIEEHIE